MRALTSLALILLFGACANESHPSNRTTTSTTNPQAEENSVASAEQESETPTTVATPDDALAQLLQGVSDESGLIEFAGEESFSLSGPEANVSTGAAIVFKACLKTNTRSCYELSYPRSPTTCQYLPALMNDKGLLDFLSSNNGYVLSGFTVRSCSTLPKDIKQQVTINIVEKGQAPSDFSGRVIVQVDGVSVVQQAVKGGPQTVTVAGKEGARVVVYLTSSTTAYEVVTATQQHALTQQAITRTFEVRKKQSDDIVDETLAFSFIDQYGRSAIVTGSVYAFIDGQRWHTSVQNGQAKLAVRGKSGSKIQFQFGIEPGTIMSYPTAVLDGRSEVVEVKVRMPNVDPGNVSEVLTIAIGSNLKGSPIQAGREGVVYVQTNAGLFYSFFDRNSGYVKLQVSGAQNAYQVIVHMYDRSVTATPTKMMFNLDGKGDTLRFILNQ